MPRTNGRINFVSIASAPDYSLTHAAGRHYFLLRRLHSLTGLVFGGYLIVHLLINATLVQGLSEGGGKTVYQIQVDKIHSLPFLPLVEWTFIYLPILYHTFYGIWVIATGHPNVDRYGYSRNWFYTLQRVSAIVLVFFMVFHIFGMKGFFGSEVIHSMKVANGSEITVGDKLTFVPVDYATQSTANHMNAAWWVWGVIYPVGILASCYHLANGFWTAGITWGLTVSSKAIHRWGIACTLLFVFTFGCGITALVSLVKMGPQPIPASHEVNQRNPAVVHSEAT
jgi:succinate dehydrogenase / fumarate reductase cytochrome b subunit